MEGYDHAVSELAAAGYRPPYPRIAGTVKAAVESPLRCDVDARMGGGAFRGGDHAPVVGCFHSDGCYPWCGGHLFGYVSHAVIDHTATACVQAAELSAGLVPPSGSADTTRPDPGDLSDLFVEVRGWGQVECAAV